MYSFIRSVNILDPLLCARRYLLFVLGNTAQDRIGTRGGCGLVGETDNRQVNKNFEGGQRTMKTI